MKPIALAIASLATITILSSRPAHGDLDLDGTMSYPVISLTVGGTYVRPSFIGTCICDDYGVVHVDINEDHRVRLTGIQPGKTLCGFSSGGKYAVRQVFSVEVNAPPTPP